MIDLVVKQIAHKWMLTFEVLFLIFFILWVFVRVHLLNFSVWEI